MWPYSLQEALPPKPLVPHSVLKGKTRFIVAAHPGVRSMLEAFAQRWGMQTLTVGSAAEAMKKLRSSQTYHAALIEEDLPDQSGRELVQDMRRQRGANSGPAVLLCVPCSNRPPGVKTSPPGFIACLTKPDPLPGSCMTSSLPRSKEKKPDRKTYVFHRPHQCRPWPAPPDAHSSGRGQCHQPKGRHPHS